MPKKIRTSHFALSLTTAARQVLPEEFNLRGQIIQNNDAAANIYIRWGGDGIENSFLKLVPGWSEVQDNVVSSEEMWAYSDVAGAVLTVVRRNEIEG